MVIYLFIDVLEKELMNEILQYYGVNKICLTDCDRASNYIFWDIFRKTQDTLDWFFEWYGSVLGVIGRLWTHKHGSV